MSTSTQQEIANPSTTRKEKRKKIITTKRITYLATLVAISVVLKILSNMIPASPLIKLSFIYTGWILASIILGPVSGACVGFISDALGMFILPTGGSINPFLTLGNTLFPFIVGICYHYLPIKNKSLSLSIGVILSIAVCTMGINSLTLFYMYKYNASMNFFTYLFTLRVMQPFIVLINLAFCLIVVPQLKRLKISVD